MYAWGFPDEVIFKLKLKDWSVPDRWGRWRAGKEPCQAEETAYGKDLKQEEAGTWGMKRIMKCCWDSESVWVSNFFTIVHSVSAPEGSPAPLNLRLGHLTFLGPWDVSEHDIFHVWTKALMQWYGLAVAFFFFLSALRKGWSFQPSSPNVKTVVRITFLPQPGEEWQRFSWPRVDM